MNVYINTTDVSENGNVLIQLSDKVDTEIKRLKECMRYFESKPWTMNESAKSKFVKSFNEVYIPYLEEYKKYLYNSGQALKKISDTYEEFDNIYGGQDIV